MSGGELARLPLAMVSGVSCQAYEGTSVPELLGWCRVDLAKDTTMTSSHYVASSAAETHVKCKDSRMLGLCSRLHGPVKRTFLSI